MALSCLLEIPPSVNGLSVQSLGVVWICDMEFIVETPGAVVVPHQ